MDITTSRETGSASARPGAVAMTLLALGVALVATAASAVDSRSRRADSSRSVPQDPVRNAGAENAVDLTRATLEKWVETERNIATARSDWALGRELLVDRIALMEREITGLETRIEETDSSIVDADAKRADLLEQSEALRAATATLAARIQTLEPRVANLVRRLPVPIQEKIRPLSQRLAKSSAGGSAGLGERFATVVGILNEVDKFHREVTMVSEVRTLSSGQAAEVTVVYFGVSKGFYVNAAGTAAGVGSAGEDGFVWTPRDDSAPEIARAVAILENRQPAAFVNLPAEMRR